MSDHNASELADIYIKMRERIRELDDKVKTIKEQQAMVADKMLELCNEQDANSLTTTNGTISRRLNSSYWTSDWDSFYNFVKDNDAYHLLEKRIHNGNMKEFLADNPDAVPMGLQARNQYIISVRKPTSK
tara:strand:- start:4120 stop:4509 length:390 start_codon:yes stop_codon:yes gene_type:complete